MEFASKAYFLLLLLLIPYILWYFLGRKKSEPTMRMSDTRMYQYAPKSLRVRLIHLPMVLRCIAFVLIVCAMARPQTHHSWDNKTVEGIDIMLAMDVSTSMLAEDLKPNRMEAAKDVANEFISGRPTDNIGLTIFAGEAFTQCPMTTDHASLLRLLQDTRTDIAARGLIDDGTAVGMGLANAVSRLKTQTLRDIAQTTDGNFYRATNNAELKKIYQDIDKLEKSKFNVKHYAKRYEAYQPFALAALLVLLLEILLRITWLRRIP